MKQIKMIFSDKKKIMLMLIFIMWFLVFRYVWPVSGDDINYSEAIKEWGLLFIWMDQMKIWTSRGIIQFFQFIIYVLPKHEWCFRIVNSLMFTLIAYCIVEYCDIDVKDKRMIVIASSIFLYPLDILTTAGWVATSANYLWTVALGMYAMLPAVMYLQGKDIKKHYYLLSTLAMLFACNEEQVSALFFGLLTCVIGYFCVKRRKIPFYFVIMDAIALSMLIFSLTWQGSKIRQASEIVNCNPVYDMQGIVEKGFNGFFSTTYYLLASNSIGIVLMCLLLAMVIRAHYEDEVIRFFGYIPAAYFLLFGTFRNVTLEIFPAFKQMYLLDFDYSAAYNSDVIVSASIQLFIVLLIGFDILVAFGGQKGLLLGVLWLGGFTTRVVIGFSPTLYESSTRTFSFLASIIIIIYAMLLKDYIDENKRAENVIIVHALSWIYLFYVV